MWQCPTYVNREDNTCDVCGADCGQVQHEFRCYKRSEGYLRGLEGIRDNTSRRLHSCRAFISKQCGRNLLGVQSASSKFLENIADIVAGDDPVEKLRELWVNASERYDRVTLLLLALHCLVSLNRKSRRRVTLSPLEEQGNTNIPLVIALRRWAWGGQGQ